MAEYLLVDGSILTVNLPNDDNIFIFYVQQHLQLHVQQLEMHSDKNNSNPDLWLFTRGEFMLIFFHVPFKSEIEVFDVCS